jgi:hypothetical protein
VDVVETEIASAMLAQLRRKVSEVEVPVVLGDMTTAQVPGEFALVYLVYGGMTNVFTQGEQVEIFRNAAQHLGPGRRFVFELDVPRAPDLAGLQALLGGGGCAACADG